MSKIEDTLVSTLKDIIKDRYDIADSGNMVMIEIPKDSNNGDYSTNLAMRLTKILKKRPQDIANEIKEELTARVKEIERVDIAGPGFINFWIKKTALADVINVVIDAGDDYGKNDSGQGGSILVEGEGGL